MEGLLTLLLSERMGVSVTQDSQRSPEAEALREQIKQSMKSEKKDDAK
jgi:hypothetical protein